MKPLNYAILKLFTHIDEVSTDDVIENLKERYTGFKALNKKEVLMTLLIAEANGLLRESRIELDEENDLKIYFSVTEEGLIIINKYIKD